MLSLEEWILRSMTIQVRVRIIATLRATPRDMMNVFRGEFGMLMCLKFIYLYTYYMYAYIVRAESNGFTIIQAQAKYVECVSNK